MPHVTTRQLPNGCFGWTCRHCDTFSGQFTNRDTCEASAEAHVFREHRAELTGYEVPQYGPASSRRA